MLKQISIVAIVLLLMTGTATAAPMAGVPESVVKAVLKAVETRSAMPAAAFRVTRSQPQTWTDGCLGLATPGTMCTQALG